MTPTSIKFDIFLTENSYVFFIFNKNENSFSAIRFSSHPDYPNQLVESKSSGEFTSIQDLTIEKVEPNVWLHVAIEMADNNNQLNLSYNDEQLTLKTPINTPQSIGFRESYNKSYVDNFSISDTQGIQFRDHFDNRDSQVKFLLGPGLLSLLVLFIFQISLFIIFNQHYKRIFLLSFSTIFCGLVFVIGLNYYLVTYYFPSYPSNGNFFSRLKQREQAYVTTELEQIDNYLMNHIHDKDPTIIRVLFLGTSQTWGAGASTEENTYVSQAEIVLNDRISMNLQSPNSSQLANQSFKKYEFINAGISGINSNEIATLYEKNWIKLSPDIIVVNLSTNDGDHVKFTSNLEKIVSISKLNTIAVIFLLEANSTESTPGSLTLHNSMTKVAERNNIRFFDLHTYLKEKRNTGIIWWDFVHPTDYGHQLISKIVVDAITQQEPAVK